MNKSSIKIIVLFIIILFSTNFVNSTELIGIVIDDYDNLVVGANLDFKCDKNFNDINFPNITNNFGAFELENIPYGKCRVFASLENKVGFIDININKDEMYQ